ncbi:TPA: hypothetical protein ACHK6D_003468 [Escherichia coli]
MITLSNSELAVTLTLEVMGYQYPDANNFWDGNWLFLKVGVTQGNQRFEKIDPAIGTYDLTKLHRWFTTLLQRPYPDGYPEKNLEFTEPCLAFEYTGYSGDVIIIKVILACALCPTFHKTENIWQAEFRLADADIALILANLESSIQDYPLRD